MQSHPFVNLYFINRPSVHPSVCPSICPSARPFIGPSVRPSFRAPGRLSVRPSIHSSVRPSVCPSVHPLDVWFALWTVDVLHFSNLYNNFYTQPKLLHVKYSLHKNKSIKVVKYSELICQHCHLKQVISSSLEIVVADLIIAFIYSDSALNLDVIAAELRHNVQTRS